MGARALEEIAGWDLHGFVLKRASPSCGLFRVKVQNDKGMPEHTGRGIFARELARAIPVAPSERKRAGSTISACGRTSSSASSSTSAGSGCSGQPHALGPGGLSTPGTSWPSWLTARSSTVRWAGLSPRPARPHGEEARRAYGPELFAALEVRGDARPASQCPAPPPGFRQEPARAGRQATSCSKRSTTTPRASTPLVVPLTLLKHHFRRCQTPDWVGQQVYLHPYPKELMLRSHA